MQDILEKFNSEYLNNEKCLWNKASLKIKDGTMDIFTFKFENNWGLIVRRILKDNEDSNTVFCGYIDNIVFHDDYYFDRPKGKSQVKNLEFANINELVLLLDNCRSLPKYESK